MANVARLRRKALPYSFVLPLSAVLLLVNFYPLIYSLRLSLSVWPHNAGAIALYGLISRGFYRPWLGIVTTALDVSVALCWVVARPLSPQALRLRDEYRRQVHDLIAPGYFPLDASTAWTKASAVAP